MDTTVLSSPRTVPGDPLTDRLLAAAVEVFTEHGFEKAGVAAVARAAGVTTGAIYARWTGKQELMLDALDLVMMDQLQMLLAPDGGDVADILGALGSGLVIRPPSVDALIAEAFVIARRDAEFHEMLTRRIAEQDARLARLIDEGKADGMIDPGLSTDSVVALCHAISIGFAMFGSIQLAPPSADDWNAVVQRLIQAARPRPQDFENHEEP